MPLTVHASNDLDALGRGLAAALAAPVDGGDPAVGFRRQLVLVPSLGMRDWLKRAIATANGVCAGVELPFPGRFVDRVLPAHLGLADDESFTAWNPTRARWALMSLLPEVPALASFTGGDNGASKERVAG